MTGDKYSFIVFKKNVLQEIKASPFQSVYIKTETQTKFLLKSLKDQDLIMFNLHFVLVGLLFLLWRVTGGW